MPQGTHAVGWGCRENGERVRTLRHTPYMRATACLIPTALPHPLSRGRELERGQQAARLVFWAVRVLGKVAEIRRMPSPQPYPTGEGAGYSEFKRYRSSEKRMPQTSTAGIFQTAFIARQMEQTPRAFFQTTFEPIGRVCTARHARGGVGFRGKWRTRAYRTLLTCELRLTVLVGDNHEK